MTNPALRGFIRWSATGLALALLALDAAHALTPETVQFDSEDGKTRLIAYLYKADAPGPYPAVVALHGRGGLYSSRARSYNAGTLSSRHKMWGEFWAARGYQVLFIDTFGPRGYPAGFAAGTIKQRPLEINEITIRPLDAYAGLKYLRSRPDVVQNLVFLQGWSNGGSATLSTMAVGAPGRRGGDSGFRAAVAVYPACTRLSDHYGRQYKTYAPLILLIGTHDDEVKPANCAALARAAKANGSNFEIVFYEGATHSYDTPIPSRQGVAANVAASEDTKRRAEAFFRLYREQN
jgi:carboxymethylenebutenolidase